MPTTPSSTTSARGKHATVILVACFAVLCTLASPATASTTNPPATTPPTVATNLAVLRTKITSQFAGRTPPAWEAKLPPTGVAPRGVVIVVHGGAWFLVGPSTLRSMDADVARWRKRGYITLNVDYRAGANSAIDVAAFHDAVLKWQGSAVPLGIMGRSAGGHLGLFIATRRAGVDFVSAFAPPTNLTRLAGATSESRGFQQSVLNMFGAAEARRLSPAINPGLVTARMLVVGARNDKLVIPANVEYMRAAKPQLVEARYLAAGATPFVHSNVKNSDLAAALASEAAMASAVAKAHGFPA